MQAINFKHLILSSLITYVIGVSFFIASFFVEFLSNPELQANIVLMMAIVPAAVIGARFYLRRNFNANGLQLGLLMFGMAILLDATITVPVFIIPAGGNHLQFFSDPLFWLIGLIYVTSVVGYTKLKRTAIL